MTVWILHQELSAEEEARITERDTLTLPFEGFPDLTQVASPLQAKQLIRTLHPEDPPEAVNRRFERLWNRYAGLHREDIIAVPLKHCQDVAIAEVTGKYRYRTGEGGTDIHLIPVKWPVQPVSLQKFRKHKRLFEEHSEKMQEVTNGEARILIRDQLPHAYNRFARWKWILVVFFAMGLVRMLHRLVSGG